MFENIIRQSAVTQLALDIQSGQLAPALLFSGPPASGKGTAALELARILLCENTKEKAAWNCSCKSCARQRALISQDLLLFGQKRFFAEISACSQAFGREPGTEGVRRLFIRSVRKLLARFSPVLWEDDPKAGKFSGLLAGLEEDLEAFERAAESGAETEKIRASVLKDAVKLEAEVPKLVPIDQIRRAAYWSRLAPAGIRKCIIIENADRMQEGAKNSLLKILEEPPERLSIVLSCSRPGTLLPTIISRLRQYRFAQRDTEAEIGVIRRIFRDKDYEAASPAGAESAGSGTGIGGAASVLSSYLESFLPVSGGALYPLGAYFPASVTAEALRVLKPRAPPVLVELGKFSAPVAEAGGMGRPAPDMKSAIAHVFYKAEHFDIPGVFSGFCKNILSLLSAWTRTGEVSPEKIKVLEIWKTELANAFIASDSYNIQIAGVFERLGENLKRALTA
jgi:DNA polymerase-3 subunit gamma/tau